MKIKLLVVLAAGIIPIWARPGLTMDNTDQHSLRSEENRIGFFSAAKTLIGLDQQSLTVDGLENALDVKLALARDATSSSGVNHKLYVFRGDNYYLEFGVSKSPSENVAAVTLAPTGNSSGVKCASLRQLSAVAQEKQWSMPRVVIQRFSHGFESVRAGLKLIVEADTGDDPELQMSMKDRLALEAKLNQLESCVGKLTIESGTSN